tara:strand:+ start:335 stop:2377 length:2043 start_codon:yes stop_codon:yes gene_type:complete
MTNFIEQLTETLVGAQQNKRQWEYGAYQGANPRYKQELGSLETKWMGIFDYLDPNDVQSVKRARLLLEDDFSSYNSTYPAEMFQSNLMKKEVSEMLDEYENRSGQVSGARLRADEIKFDLEKLITGNEIENSFKEYMAGNKGKTQQDWRNHLVENIYKYEQDLNSISKNMAIKSSTDPTEENIHKIRQNKFFNANLLSVDGLDSLLSDVDKSSQFLEAIKGEFTTGVDASRVLDGFDPEGGEYTLRHQITESEAQDLKNILYYGATPEYDKKEQVRANDNEAKRGIAINQQKVETQTYSNLENVKAGILNDYNVNISEGERLSWDDFPATDDEHYAIIKPGTSTPYTVGERDKFIKEFYGTSDKVPVQITSLLDRLAAKGNPEVVIRLSKAMIDASSKSNMDRIRTNDQAFLTYFDDINYSQPVAIEALNPNIYPETLVRLLNSEDPEYGRHGGKYAKYGDIINIRPEDSPTLNSGEVKQLNKEVEQFYKEANVGPLTVDLDGDGIPDLVDADVSQGEGSEEDLKQNALENWELLSGEEKQEYDYSFDKFFAGISTPAVDDKAKAPLNAKQLSVAKPKFEKFKRQAEKNIDMIKTEIDTKKTQMNQMTSFNKESLQRQKNIISEEIKSLEKSLIEQEGLLKNTDINTWVYTMTDEREKNQILSGQTSAQTVQDYWSTRKR